MIPPVPETPLDTPEVLELLAAWDHKAWASWTRHLLDKMTPENVARWNKQIETDYADLPEHSKEADRQEAREILALVRPLVRTAQREAAERIWKAGYETALIYGVHSAAKIDERWRTSRVKAELEPPA